MLLKGRGAKESFVWIKEKGGDEKKEKGGNGKKEVHSNKKVW